MGVRALERLRAHYTTPPEVGLLDGGTMGLDLLPYLSGVSRLLLLDAVDTDSPPGALSRLAGDTVPAVLAHKMSMHQVGLQELLAVASLHGSLPSDVVLLGLQPAVVDWGTELSAPLESALDTLVAAGVQQLRAWGVAVTDRDP